MVKRSRIVEVTKEANALRRLRIVKGLSMRQLADELRLSHTTVSHVENGRANISEEYINHFLKILGFSQKDWQLSIEKNERHLELREKCLFLIRKMDEQNLNLVYGILQNF